MTVETVAFTIVIVIIGLTAVARMAARNNPKW
jgi:hypothetical protein